jgi:formylglycine-generating enzyme required for sulfatase activity
VTTLWTCTSCQHDNPPAARFCGGCAAPRPTTDLSITGDPTSAGRSPATPPPPPRPASSPDLSISGDRTYADGGPPRDPAAGTALQPGLRVGRDARYELLAKLGEGGMGAVWRARDTQLDRDVAIKRILGLASPMLRERFQRETKAVTALRHSNIVTVFDAGEDAFGLYLVMEFVPGQTLDQVLRKGPMPAQQAVAIMAGLCRGAAHAHKRGVVHRDIKPSNVMLDDDGTPHLIDFGLVRMDGASDLSLTTSGMGTYDYAAPEQKRDASKADARSDVYALGVVFYELLTGLRPPVTPKRVPEAWRALVEKAADGVAADRHATAEELLVDIEAIQAQSATETYSAHMLGGEDDLRCPSCKLLNALEAKLCRKCGTSLRLPCPACNQTIRTGLQHCDQCFANVSFVVQLRSGLDAVRGVIQEGRVKEAAASLDALRPMAESGKLGPASALTSAWSEQRHDVARREGEARSAIDEAEQALGRQDFERADRHWQQAIRLDRSHEAEAAAWQARFAAAQQAHAAAVAAVRSKLAGLRAAADEGRLRDADAGLAALLGDLDPLQVRWHGEWVRTAVELQQQVAQRRAAAAGLVGDAKDALALWDDERAIEWLQGAAAKDDAHAEHAQAIAAAAPARIARRAGALALLRERAQSALASIRARDMAAAQAAVAAFADGEWRECAPAWLERDEPARLRREVEQALAILATDFAAADLLVAEADAALAAREDEAAIAALQRAADLRPQYAGKLAAVRAASGMRIAARDEARAEHANDVEGMRAALQAGWLRQAEVWGRDLEGRRDRVGSSWWQAHAAELADLRAQEARLASAITLHRRLRRVRAAGAIALMVLSFVVCSTWYVRRSREADAAERLRVKTCVSVALMLTAWLLGKGVHEARKARASRRKAASGCIEEIRVALAAGDDSAPRRWRALVEDLGGDPRLNALRSGAEQVAEAKLRRCLQDIGPRLQRGEVAALAEWQDLSAWFGRDPRLAPLRAAAVAAAAAAEDRLRRAGLAAAPATTRDLATGLPRKVVHIATGAELVLIPAGEFTMGSPTSEVGRDGDEVQHRRQIRKSFYLGVTEVTQAQWRKVMGSNPSNFQGDDLPVEQVSWDDCQQFVQKAGGGLRLPSEAEWEYACRAGTTTPFSFGATITPAQVNYDGNYPYDGESKGLYRERTVAAGSLLANAWGLHEMHGNVWEWCQDGYEAYPGSGTEEPSRAAGVRVLRGGSWSHYAYYCRAAFRRRREPGYRYISIGLRLARTLPE